jgi:mono/diheme cytochrome c family protein/glucose/arabinose dehydrogenase
MLPALLVAAQDADEDQQPLYRSGWIGVYRDDHDTTIRRVDDAISFQWQKGGVDERLVPGPLRAEWQGALLTRTRGDYQVAAFAAGKLRFALNGETWMDADVETPQWTVSQPHELSFGWHKIHLSLDADASNAQLKLFWRGPNFQWEPINPANLFHLSETTPRSDFSTGKLLASALRCVACHGDEQSLAAPPLVSDSVDLRRSWIAEYLQRSNGENSHREHRRMPYFELSATDAADLATYLGTDRAEATPPADPSLVRSGREMFLKRGCVACHYFKKVGSVDWLDGGSLSDVGTKRSADYLRKWLTDPAKLRPDHRMPRFVWEKGELDQIVAFLASNSEFEPQEVAGDATRGMQLYGRMQCGSCHSNETKPVAKTLHRESQWRDACSGTPIGDGSSRSRPRYQLDDKSRQQLRDYFSDRRPLMHSQSPWLRGQQVFQEQRCVACHARGSAPGLASKLRGVADEYPHLAAEIPAVTPPSLNSVGDKLTIEALQRAIRRDGKQLREWLSVQMPRFELNEQDETALIAYLRGSDAFPDGSPRRLLAQAPANLGNIGARLVTTDGFGCTSCHQIGKTKPPKAPLNAMGPDLSMLGKRIHREWFERWVRDPSRIVPRMEMPSIKAPVHGILDENLDVQLAAVWETLNRPGFTPPAANPVRTVRRSGVRETQQRSVVLTDVVRNNGSTLIRPLIIGLPNRHNVLFDLETASLGMWWTGDTARQRAEGKSWFWELGNQSIWSDANRSPDLVLVGSGRRIAPVVQGQFVTEFDWLRHHASGVQFAYRLFFPREVGVGPMTVLESLQPIWGDDESGWVRKIEVQQVPQGWRVELKAWPLKKPAVVEEGSYRISAQSSIRIIRAGSTADVSGWLRAGEGQKWILEYRTGQLVDRFADPGPERTVDVVRDLPAIVPGFRARSLPLDRGIMPTGIQWLADGKIVICSLKGRVWLMSDSDGDGIEDRLVQFSDELAAPFGAAAGPDYIDVINKYALLRLFDRDADGFAEEMRTVASGWGHTADYHDWTIGLPTRHSGGYFVSIACQQDNRSLAASLHRGVVAAIVPRQPTAADPRIFSVEPISGGHRFAIGIATNKAGQLFVTDNQGNYNPYNELNHVQQGNRFGFINGWEKSPAFNPPLTEPAINIPHPWTRSVNGICFLESKTEDAFGPFTGHLVGCELDSRRLVRMSLQEVNGQLQGAIYPMSRYHPVDGKTFLGPLVAAVSPTGSLYIGGIRDSGWGGANNIGALTRLDYDPERLGVGIAVVQATPDGFEIEWTQAIDQLRAGQLDQYQIESARRESTPSYGGGDIDRRIESVTKVEVLSPTRVRLTLAELKAGFVYDIRVRNIALGDASLFPAEAFYTMREIPQ